MPNFDASPKRFVLPFSYGKALNFNKYDDTLNSHLGDRLEQAQY
jgi:hypothetical protein